MRLLLDTNVLTSAALTPQGAPAQLIEAWLDGKLVLVSSEFQLTELARVLTYERIRSRLAPQEANVIVGRIRALADLVEPTESVTDSPDPDDNRILAAALAGAVDAIVSGDKPGMLALESVGGIPVLMPAEALRRL